MSRLRRDQSFRRSRPQARFSLLWRRLELFLGDLRAEFDHAPAGDLRLISLCAGQGRDVIGVLAAHPRRDEVRARLVELDDRNVAIARQAAQPAGLDGVEVLPADAGATDLRGHGPRPDRGGVRDLRQHQRQRHPGHGGGPAQPLRAQCARPVDQAPQTA
jgi:hypothetical protein